MVAKRIRSPNYPLFNLEQSLELAEKLYDHAQHHYVPIGTAFSRWELKEGTYAQQVVGALRQFGLIETTGIKEKRQIRVTQEAAKAIEGHPDRSSILKRMALLPNVHKAVWDEYGEDLPPDDTLRHYLLFDHKPRFNRTSVDGFLKQFRESIGFAGVGEDSDIGHDIGDDAATDGAEDNQDTGTDRNPPDPQFRYRPQRGGQVRQDVYTIDEGDVVLSWPSDISDASIDELSDWLALVERKIRRLAKQRAEGHEPRQDRRDRRDSESEAGSGEDA